MIGKSQPTTIRAEYGPFQTSQTLPAQFVLPDPIELYSTTPKETKRPATSNLITDFKPHPLDLSAHFVTQEVQFQRNQEGFYFASHYSLSHSFFYIQPRFLWLGAKRSPYFKSPVPFRQLFGPVWTETLHPSHRGQQPIRGQTFLTVLSKSERWNLRGRSSPSHVLVASRDAAFAWWIAGQVT